MRAKLISPSRAVLLAASVAVASPAPSHAQTAPWPMFRHDTAHTGRSPSMGPLQPFLAWSYATGGTILGSSPAISASGRIYIGSFNNILYSLEASGACAWSYATGGIVFSSPALDADERAHVTSFDGFTYAIDSSGALAWSYRGQPLPGDVLSSPTTGTDGRVYAGSGVNRLLVFTPGASLAWSYDVGDDVMDTPAVGSDGRVYAGSRTPHMFALESSGALAWSYEADGKITSSPAIGADGRVHFAGNDGRFFVLGSSGRLAWSYDHTHDLDSSPALGTDGAVHYGNSTGNAIYCMESSGALRWSYAAAGGVFSSPALNPCGGLYVGSLDARVYSLAPGGSLEWSFQTGGSVYSSPSIGADGRLYVGSTDGVVYALAGPPEFGFAVVSNAGPPAPQPPGDTISFINCDSLAVIDTIPVGRRPQGVAITRDRQWVYVANEDDRTVSVLHSGVRAVAADIPVPLAPRGVKESADGRSIYVTCGLEGETGAVAVIGRDTGTVERVVPVGERPSYGIVEAGGYLFVSNRDSNDISAIDTEEWREVGRIRGLDWPVGMAVLGDELYVANYSGDKDRRAYLTVIGWRTPPATVETPHPWQVLACMGMLYVTNYHHDHVTAVDPASRRVTAAVGVACGPDGIAASPDGEYLYVVNALGSPISDDECDGRGILSVIRRADLSVVALVGVGDYPSQIAVAGPARGDWPCTCPLPGAGANLCVAEPEARRGGMVDLSYRLAPGLVAPPADALLGVILPDGSLYSFTWNLSGLAAVSSPVDVRTLQRVGRGLDTGIVSAGTLSFPVSAHAPAGDYRFVGALLPSGTDDVIQIPYSNRFTVR